MWNLFDPLETTGGFWSPILWIIAFLVAFLIAYIIWGLGERKHGAGEQGKPFLSGTREPAKEAVHIRAGNIYWGFTETLHGYYDAMKKIHTGIVNDYVLWFLGMAALFFVILILPEVIG
ncbi:MAG: hydrogenase [Candidatus Thermoplasmatota archaeon]|nr:hydrogenase [Candidatus Thermoplasmatota archaeon]